MKWCFFPPPLAFGVRIWAGKFDTGVLGASLAVSDWSVVVVSPHPPATVHHTHINQSSEDSENLTVLNNIQVESTHCFVVIIIHIGFLLVDPK